MRRISTFLDWQAREWGIKSANADPGVAAHAARMQSDCLRLQGIFRGLWKEFNVEYS